MYFGIQHPVESPGHLTHNPFHVGTNRAMNNQSLGPAQHGDLSVPTTAARPTVCLSAPLLGLDEQLPY